MNKNDTVVIFGGSFNPPLNSHFSIAEHVLNEYKNVEKIIFVPVNTNYNKKGLIKSEHRYNMLKKVTDKNNKFEVSDIDIIHHRNIRKDTKKV